MRGAFLAILGLDIVLVGVGVANYPAFLRQPGSLAYLAEPLVLLVIYVAVVLAVTGRTGRDQRRLLWAAAIVGLATGAMEVANISVETFTNLSGPANLATTAPFILGPFVIWGVVGGWAARATGSLRLGLLAAVWSAMVTMVVGVTYGFALALTAPGRLTRILADDPDRIRSGWSDVRAYVLANAFDNGFTHLLGAVLVGTAVGLVGGLVGVRWSRAHAAG